MLAGEDPPGVPSYTIEERGRVKEEVDKEREGREEKKRRWEVRKEGEKRREGE